MKHDNTDIAKHVGTAILVSGYIVWHLTGFLYTDDHPFLSTCAAGAWIGIWSLVVILYNFYKLAQGDGLDG